MKEEWEASAGGAYRTKRGIGQGILAPLAIAMLTLLIGTIVRCSATEAHAAVWDVRLTEFVEKAMEEASTPGAIIGIWQDGASPYVRAFGVRDTATGEPMATDLHMRIGSVTKTFVTTAILQLVDQGQVNLDDPISKYVPGVPNGDAVTLRQLAGMRSGLFDYSDVAQAAMPAPEAPAHSPRPSRDHRAASTGVSSRHKVRLQQHQHRASRARGREGFRTAFESLYRGAHRAAGESQPHSLPNRCFSAVAARPRLYEDARRQDCGWDGLESLMGMGGDPLPRGFFDHSRSIIWRPGRKTGHLSMTLRSPAYGRPLSGASSRFAT